MSIVLDLAICALVLGLGFRVIAARDTLAAVIAFIGCGLALALLWVRLSAVDVALTEAAVGSGVTGLLLLRAASRPQPKASPTPGRALKIAAALLSAGVAGALAVAMISLPTPAPSLAPEAAQNLARTGLGNPVTAVLVAYRALDTLLETVVLLLALVGVWSLGSSAQWGGTSAPLGTEPAAPPLVFIGRVLPPFGVLIGIHLLWTGADAPGGAFQGGAVIAAMWLLALLAGSGALPAPTNRRLRILVVVGPLLFMAMGMLGIAIAGSFLAFPDAIAKPLILIIEAGLTLSIAVALGLMVAGPATRAAP